MDIPVLLASITSAIGIAKELREIDRGLGEADFKMKIAELTASLADTKIALVDLQEELQAKDREIGRLRSAFEFRGSTVVKNGCRYEDRGDGTPQGNAFCPRCEQKDGFLMRLADASGPRGSYVCPECNVNYEDLLGYSYPD